MRNSASANSLSFFALGMSVCLLYSSEFFILRRARVFDGYTCPDSKRVLSVGKVYSDMQCALYCKKSSSCVDIFYQPEKRRCDGCMYFLETELEIADGSLHYTRRDCGIPSSIAYGNISLKSGTNFMDRATVNCDPRFRARPDEITCTFNGIWETAFCEEYDCYIQNTRSYRGKRNITKYGNICKRWDDNSYKNEIRVNLMPEASFSEAENYCRCPTLRLGHLLCYVSTDTGTVMETCGIQGCG
ncbi:tyrosine-protein kinase transmembrane receptor Ror2-like [Ruditapes philippinarum]|uniref:tyrosine-protein kinase transmembrane receptor Ror2-like n=1 Tax=Ruditapes philippinarum TaxID=129788 RepID=UPI00295B572E|nr:tyrosine-protein kinase transmembrane receptor Ror2-like [Ruditapes philippinarum]